MDSKKILLITMLSAFWLLTYPTETIAQNNATVQEYADIFGTRLYNKCSVWGGKNLHTQVKNHHYNSATDVLTIEMQVNWKGSISQRTYYIHGKLYIHEDGSSEWQKIRDSYGFPPGCGSTVIDYNLLLSIAEKVLLRRRYRRS